MGEPVEETYHWVPPGKMDVSWWYLKIFPEEAMTAKNKSLPGERLEQWMICREPAMGKYSEQPNPKKLYDNEAAARHDAESLCMEQGRPFYLLKVVAVVEQSHPPLVWREE